MQNTSNPPGYSEVGHLFSLEQSAPIHLTWTPPDDIAHDLAIPTSREPETEIYVQDQAAVLSTETIERPPEYERAQIPIDTVRYTFSPIGSNAMVLLPTSEVQDTRPRYYITVSMDCFMPLSHITTIHRGVNDQGPVVAQFEMGIIDASSRVQIGGHVKLVSQMLDKVGSRREGAIWSWTLPRVRGQEAYKIVWDYTRIRDHCACKGITGSTTTRLAMYKPHLGHHLGRSQSRLEVTPEGHEFFDHVVLSLLVVERRRLTPSQDSVHKALFN